MTQFDRSAKLRHSGVKLHFPATDGNFAYLPCRLPDACLSADRVVSAGRFNPTGDPAEHLEERWIQAEIISTVAQLYIF